jgi:hypothetical protein
MTPPNSSGDPGGQGPDQPGDGTAGTSPAPGGDPGTGATETFTQEQVNTLLRSERAKAAVRYSDYDQLKARLAELEAAGQTELEKAQTKAQEANDRASAAVAERNRLLVRSVLVSEAARAGAVDPEIVVALLEPDIKVDDAGNIEGDMKALVAKLLEDRPFLRNGQPTGHGSADGGTRGRQTTPSPVDRMNDLIRGG